VPSYYYIDLFFDCEVGEAVEGTVSAAIEAGCRFERVAMGDVAEGDHAAILDPATLGPSNLAERGQAFVAEHLRRGERAIGFPPWGRILFTFPFEFDEALQEDMREEERECHSSARDVGLSFLYERSPLGDVAPRVRASISFWEDYVLSLGSEEAHEVNMSRMLALVEGIYETARPYFGALNDEIHINAERSFETLTRGDVPRENEFVLVGRRVVGRLNTDALVESGVTWKVLSDGGLLLQTRRRWG
jgi:hypothetical protein